MQEELKRLNRIKRENRRREIENKKEWRRIESVYV